MLKKPPKDQIERYTTPPSGKLFKGTKHNEGLTFSVPGGRTPKLHQTRRPDFKGKGAK